MFVFNEFNFVGLVLRGFSSLVCFVCSVLLYSYMTSISVLNAIKVMLFVGMVFAP